MNRSRLGVTALVLVIGLVAPVGVAAADDAAPTTSPDPTTSPSTSPSAAATTAANVPPVAVDDSFSGGVAGSTRILDVLANDTDSDGPQPLAVAAVTDPSGRARLVDGLVRFTSRAGDGGTKPTFTYTVTDGATDGTGTDTATVTVAVSAPPPPRTVGVTLPATVVALRHYSVHGTVRPVAPAPVEVRVHRYYRGAWHTWKNTRAGRSGRFGVAFSTNRTARYVFRAVAIWPDGKRATSPTLRRTVVGRPDATVSGPLSRSAVRWSYRAGCPVRPSGLRRITINRYTYAGTVARGSLVVRAGAVPDLLTVFRAAFRARFKVRSMRPTDAFYAQGRRTPTQSDVAAMRADNTSAFNCRPVTGNPYRVSQHSYGNAIDINTVRNPYVVGSRVYPSFARTYLHRGNVRTGMITRRGTIASTMRRLGWPWGARWSHPDYQHFSSNGG